MAGKGLIFSDDDDDDDDDDIKRKEDKNFTCVIVCLELMTDLGWLDILKSSLFETEASLLQSCGYSLRNLLNPPGRVFGEHLQNDQVKKRDSVKRGHNVFGKSNDPG